MHVLQIRRYEGGNSQLTLDASLGAGSSRQCGCATLLAFDVAERGPDEELVEAASRLPKKECEAIRAMMVKSQVASVNKKSQRPLRRNSFH